jgi:hypothetical protein
MSGFQISILSAFLSLIAIVVTLHVTSSFLPKSKNIKEFFGRIFMVFGKDIDARLVNRNLTIKAIIGGGVFIISNILLRDFYRGY